MKKIIGIGILLGSLTATAFAASPWISPAEIAAELTGRPVQEITSERIKTGKTYGQIALDAGKFEEFKTRNLEARIEQLDQRVKAGQMTEQRADEIKKTIAQNQLTCDGTGAARIGRSKGAGFGNGSMNGNHQGYQEGLERGQNGNHHGDGYGYGRHQR